MSNQASSSTNDDMIKAFGSMMDKVLRPLMDKVTQIEAKHENLSTFVSQMANSKSEEDAKKGVLPSNTVVNPRGLNAITLRSGKELGLKHNDENKDAGLDDNHLVNHVESEVKHPPTSANAETLMQPSCEPVVHEEQVPQSAQVKPNDQHGASCTKGKEVSIKDLPFPNSYLQAKKKKDESLDNELYALFSKIEVNIPLLELVKQPKYAKFLRDLCKYKKRFKPNEMVQVPSNVSALFKPQLPVKCQDPGSFTIPCTIGKHTISRALLDLGAAINMMPKSVYESLGTTLLKPTSVILQLADQTVRYPHGVLEDVLVKVNDLLIPADFYVLDMSKERLSEGALILGRPFMRTANTEIKMKEGSITMSVGDQFVHFNMYETMKHPHEDYSLLDVHFIDDLHDTYSDEHGLASSDHLKHVGAYAIHSTLSSPPPPLSPLHGSDVICSSASSLDYTLSTPCCSKDIMFVESSTNPNILEKGSCSSKNAGLSNTMKISPMTSCEVALTMKDHSNLNKVFCQRPTSKASFQGYSYDVTKKGRIKEVVPTLLPLHALSIDPSKEDLQAQRSPIEVGKLVMAFVPSYSSPHEVFKDTWVGPFEVMGKSDKRTYELKDGYGGLHHARANRLRLYLSSHKPP